MIYTLALHLYAFCIECAAIFNRKARMMCLGQWKTNTILRENIILNAKYIWFHAASLGEFEQGRPMIEKIKMLYPQYKILLSFFSPSGYEVRKNYSMADVVCYLPFDTPFRVRKYIDLANPAIAIFIKYEFWNNYLRELKKRHVPTYSISAIFRREQWFFKWYGFFFVRILKCFDHLFVQDTSSVDLLAKYGIASATVVGDTRFDRVNDVRKQTRPIGIIESFIKAQSDQYCLIAGSSWPKDEKIFIQYFNQRPKIKLIIAPHEINDNHLFYIHSLLKRPSIRLSEADEHNIDDKDCLIIDCVGMLSSIYCYGDIAYLGGGFDKGIHNILEAAVYGLPVIFGPRFFKYKEAKELIAVSGAFSVRDEQTFTDCIDKLVANSLFLNMSGQAAAAFVERNIGATGRILRIILS
ncbi:MAG: 3-deoxy-D-manno-octulosonic acid transferase [Tannerellaceae bacterium]|nr:3-deoxy-D-manno-octulosonic acid transferase [Tannerellaceae bacterium]